MDVRRDPEAVFVLATSERATFGSQLSLADDLDETDCDGLTWRTTVEIIELGLE
jgi:hypothetical protein